MSSQEHNRILIVEDSPIMAEVLRRNLERVGLNVTVARNGVEGSDLVADREFDAVVTDYQMPRMDGREFVRNLRMTTQNCTVPVIFVSGKGLELDTEQLRIELGIRAFLFKPYSPSQLISVIQHCLANADDDRGTAGRVSVDPVEQPRLCT